MPILAPLIKFNLNYINLRVFDWLSVGIFNVPINHALRDKRHSDGPGLWADRYLGVRGSLFFVVEKTRLARKNGDLSFG